MALNLDYRPKTLDEMVGNETVIKSVRNHFAQEPKRISHCHVLYGPSGCGKTTLARIIATELLGADEKFGIHENNTADNRGIDGVRGIIDSTKKLPLMGNASVYVIDECFPGETEILTNYGFKPFKDLDGTEQVAQYKDNGEVEFVKPLRYIKKRHTGILYSWNAFKDRTIRMTPHHVQPLVVGKHRKLVEDYIGNIKFAQSKSIIVSGSGAGSKKKLSALDRLAILSQADGTINYSGKETNRWIISFRKDRKIQRFLQIIKETESEGVNVNWVEIPYDRKGYKRYAYSTPKSVTKDLRTHFDLDVSCEYAQQFIEELINWDGYRYPNGNYLYYSSVVKENVDFCSALAFLAGYRSNICVETDNRNQTFSDVYRLTLCKKSLHVTVLANKTLHTEEFTGNVYCVEVPSHKIIVRASGQFPFVTGNCHGLTPEAKAAFLKPVEEPPSYVYFFFCTTDVATFFKGDAGNALKNRCTPWKLEPLNARQLGRLVLRTADAENFDVADEVLSAIIEAAEGSPRLALKALEQVMACPGDIQGQLKLLETGVVENPDTLDLCRVVTAAKPSWSAIRDCLAKMKGKVDAETARRSILGYCSAIMLKSGGSDRICRVMEEFAVNTYDTGFPGLVLSAYRSLK